jgi:uncharacterized protein (TIGR00369 family)
VPAAPTPEEFDALGTGKLPGLIGIRIVDVAPGSVRSRLDIRPEHQAPNGYLHAATVVALADTSCGYGCRASLPEGATGFTTIELKANFLGSLTQGALACEARLRHGGRTTQLWDAEVSDEGSGKGLALFRCTQLILRP